MSVPRGTGEGPAPEPQPVHTGSGSRGPAVSGPPGGTRGNRRNALPTRGHRDRAHIEGPIRSFLTVSGTPHGTKKDTKKWVYQPGPDMKVDGSDVGTSIARSDISHGVRQTLKPSGCSVSSVAMMLFIEINRQWRAAGSFLWPSSDGSGRPSRPPGTVCRPPPSKYHAPAENSVHQWCRPARWQSAPAAPPPSTVKGAPAICRGARCGRRTRLGPHRGHLVTADGRYRANFHAVSHTNG